MQGSEVDRGEALATLRPLALVVLIFGLFICASVFLLGQPRLPAGVPSPSSSPPLKRPSAIKYYVSPSGDDSNLGLSTSLPFRSIQRAIELAQPGDTVTLAPGIYLQDILSRRDGTADAPITLTGPPGAILAGGGAGRVVEINHSYITLQGVTIDGLYGNPNSAAGYRDRLLYVIGNQANRRLYGFRALGVNFRNALTGCVRLRYFTTGSEIGGSTFQNCGLGSFRFGAKDQVGIALEIGTSLDLRGQFGAPTADPDQSNDNWVHDNDFNTQANQCVEVAEDASGNQIQDNKCTGQLDPASQGIGVRGSHNILRGNEIFGNVGAGLSLGGEKPTDGLYNDVYQNNLHDNRGGGIRLRRAPQGMVCGNILLRSGPNEAGGGSGALFNPTAPCPEVTSRPTLRAATPAAPAQESTPVPTSPSGTDTNQFRSSG